MRLKDDKRIDPASGEVSWRYGCSIGEIAEMMGLKPDAIRHILRTALRKLSCDPQMITLNKEYLNTSD